MLLAAMLPLSVEAVAVPVEGTPVVPMLPVVAMPSRMSSPVAVVMSGSVAVMVPTPVLPVASMAMVITVPTIAVVGVGQRDAGC